MPVTKIYFDVRDVEYFKRLGEYMMLNYGMYFEIAFDKPDSGMYFTVSDYINRRNRKDLFLIKGENGNAGKYEKASDICKKLMEAFDAGCSIRERMEHTELVSFFSAAGGEGKTTISQAISCSLSSKGNNVLYVNADPISSGDGIFVDQEKNSFSLLRYYLGKKENVPLRAIASRNTERRVDYIVNKRPDGDGFITKAEAAVLIEGIDKYDYDYIVFDIPSYPVEGNLEIMRNSGCCFLVSRDNGARNKAYRNFLESSGVKITAEIKNFSDEGDHSVPMTDGIFNKHPRVFWNSINEICKLAGGGNGQS